MKKKKNKPEWKIHIERLLPSGRQFMWKSKKSECIDMPYCVEIYAMPEEPESNLFVFIGGGTASTTKELKEMIGFTLSQCAMFL